MPLVYLQDNSICIEQEEGTLSVPFGRSMNLISRLEDAVRGEFFPIGDPEEVEVRFDGEKTRIEQGGHFVRIDRDDIPLLLELISERRSQCPPREKPLSYYELWQLDRSIRLESRRVALRDRAERDPNFAEKLRRDLEQEAHDESIGIYPPRAGDR